MVDKVRGFQAKVLPALAVLGCLAIGIAVSARRQGVQPGTEALPTGKRIAPVGTQTNVGSFPANMALSPDGKWIAVTDTGYRQLLSILSAQDGHLVAQLPFNPGAENEDDHTSLYVGLAFGPTVGTSTPLYVSRGPEDKISVFNVDATGKLTPGNNTLSDPSGLTDARKRPLPNFIAGLALDSKGTHLYATHNETSAATDQKGSISILDIAGKRVLGRVQTAGFPYAIAAVTTGPNADKKVYVSSERDGVVSVLDVSDPTQPHALREIKTGDHPLALLLDKAQARLFVANADSDTLTVIDTASDQVTGACALRGRSHLPGITPSALALSPDETRLYVTLADMNAVGVVEVKGSQLRLLGQIPVGWYPTSVLTAGGGKTLFVANAKGVQTRNPNAKPTGPNGERGTYIENIIEGTVAVVPTPSDEELKRLSATVAQTNSGSGGQIAGRSETKEKPGIKHVIYIIKENRTYDQILGDLPQGNGDPSLVMFGHDVTPNLHALAERFVLLDNFYCAAEVSADGWNWSTSGMGNEYVERNVPFNYSGRGRDYDYEGATNGTPVDLVGLPNVAKAPGGYLWDAAARKGLTYRNYGFFVAFGDAKDKDGKLLVKDNAAQTRTLTGHTDDSFRRFDMNYADSDAYRTYNATYPKQVTKYGEHDASSRYAEWKHEFDGYVQSGNLPQLMMVRLPRNHTSGTSSGVPSPRAMVADNDYAVGQLVEAVSKSRFWKDTAIFVIEDDAQNGMDHVDAHRSPAFVISPWVTKNTVDHHFYNTCSVLHTMEHLLGLPPMCQYDAIAPLLAVFGNHPANEAPYSAILPAREIISEINGKTAYHAAQSARLDFSQADRVPDAILNDILWHAVKGVNTPMPAIRHTVMPAAARHDDGDDD
jgi:DNA-binding beta-propeller fold protein YncE